MLNRNTPLKSNTQKTYEWQQNSRRNNTLKKSRMKPASKKTAKANRDVAPERAAFRAEMGKCCMCNDGCGTIHEIFGGSIRSITVADRAFWLPACWDCHIESLQHMAKVYQLAIKRHVDPEHFDFDRVNKVLSNGNGGQRFTVKQVDKAEALLREELVIE